MQWLPPDNTHQVGYPKGNGTEKLTDTLSCFNCKVYLSEFKTYAQKQKERVKGKLTHTGRGTSGWN